MDPFDASFRKQLIASYECRDIQQLIRDSETSEERLKVLHKRTETNRYDQLVAFVVLLSCWEDRWDAGKQTLVGDRLASFVAMTTPPDQ